jgi:hypothetical protein
MLDKCDICGFQLEPNSRYCGGCGVDLKETNRPEYVPIDKILDNAQDTINALSMQEKPKKDEVIFWCHLHALCNSYEKEFPDFLMISLLLAGGKKYLGFCECHVCSQGYRQLLAWLTKTKEGKEAKLTAQSREVVIRARNTEINGISFDISRISSGLKEKETDQALPKKDRSNFPKPSTGKITIEIGSDVLEEAVIKVLNSEKGREIIQSVPRKYAKRMRMDH